MEDRLDRMQMIEDYNASLARRKHDMELWINETNERRTLLFLWYAGKLTMSEANIQGEYLTCPYFDCRFLSICTSQRFTYEHMIS